MTYLRLVFNWLWKFIRQSLCFNWSVQNQNRFPIFVKPVQTGIFVFPPFGPIEFSQISLFAWRRMYFKLRLLESISNYPQNMFLRFYFVLFPLVNIMHQNPQLVNILIFGYTVPSQLKSIRPLLQHWNQLTNVAMTQAVFRWLKFFFHQGTKVVI